MTDDDGYARIAAQFSLLQGEVISVRARAEKAEAEATSLHGAVKTLNVTLGLVRYRAEVAEVRATALENALAGIAAAARAHDDHGIAYLCEDALKGNA